MMSSIAKERIPNFRRASTLSNIYRCSAPDRASELFSSYDADHERQLIMSEAEQFLLYDVTLWIDLRWDKEISRDQTSLILNGAPGGNFQKLVQVWDETNFQESEQIQPPSSNTNRFYINISADMDKENIEKMIERNLIPVDSMKKATTETESEMVVMRALDEHGMLGMNYAILLNYKFTSQVLKAITLHLEQQPDGKVLIHCTLGKDRTGMISMLCEYLAGLPDKSIIEDYTKSNTVRDIAKRNFELHYKGMLHPSVFAGAEAETMEATLELIRKDYGSIENYLNSVGFDQSWRNRFQAVVET